MQGAVRRGAYGDNYEREEDYPLRSSVGVLGSTDQRRHSEYLPHDRDQGEGLDAAVRGTGGEDEVRVQRVEEELRAG